MTMPPPIPNNPASTPDTNPIPTKMKIMKLSLYRRPSPDNQRFRPPRQDRYNVLAR